MGEGFRARGEPWIFDDHGGLQGYRQTPRDNLGGQTVTVPIDKSILFRTTVSRGNPEGRAICRAMYRPWYMAHNLEEIEAISAERFGNGLPTFYLGDGTTPAYGQRKEVSRRLAQRLRADLVHAQVDELRQAHHCHSLLVARDRLVQVNRLAAVGRDKLE